MHVNIRTLALSGLLPLALIGCDRSTPAPNPPSETPAASTEYSQGATSTPSSDRRDTIEASQQPSDPTVAAFLGVEAPKPATWIWHPPRNPMIHTNYTVPGVGDSKAAHLNIYFFEGMGGPIPDNIERWKNQFRSSDGYEVEPIIDEFEVDGMPVTFVELEGEWMQMGAAWYTRDQLFLAAIIDAPVGRIFLRFAGDQATVEHNREPFMKMVREMRQVEPVEDTSGAASDAGEGGGY